MISGEDKCVREAAHVYSPHFCPKSLPPVPSSSNGINRSFKQGSKQPRGFTSFDFTQPQAPSATLLSATSLSREELRQICPCCRQWQAASSLGQGTVHQEEEGTCCSKDSDSVNQKLCVTTSFNQPQFTDEQS